MDIQLHMPFWAIFYCGFIFANGVLTVIISQNKNPFYIISELLSTAFAISFFFIYYGIVDKPENTILVLMILFILFQEIWINRELYNKLVFQQIPASERGSVLGIIAVILLIFLLPLFYILTKIFNF